MSSLRSISLVLCLSGSAFAVQATPDPSLVGKRCAVFLQAGFPTIESEPFSAPLLSSALQGFDVTFLDVAALTRSESLNGVNLLVLPYGSAFPIEAWPTIRDHVMKGGNLLNLGGRPLFVPVCRKNGKFQPLSVRNSHARELGLLHSYEAPQTDWDLFAWEDDFSFNPSMDIRLRRVFVMAAQRHATYYRGLGYLMNQRGERIAAPIVRQDFIGGRNGPTPLGGARCVFLSFDPEPGYWASSDGQRLIRWAAQHAARGAISLWLEVQNATLAPGEPPQVIVHVQRSAQTTSFAGKATVRVELMDGREILESHAVDCAGAECRSAIVFTRALRPGFYVLRGTYADRLGASEGHLTGVWSRDERLIRSGATLAVDGDYFRLDKAPYLPIGVNYFSTDVHATGFFVGDNLSGNAYRWEQDLAEMARRGITFVRTGTWQNHLEYQDKVTGGVQERYIRALEAFLHSAARHGIQVQYTFFAFNPQTIRSGPDGPLLGAGSHPYIDPVAIQAQSRYVTSIVSAFKDTPFLSWDLINEPNYSNPRQLWSGNVPNGDPVELSAWRDWLRGRYVTALQLAQVWNSTAEALGGDDLDGVPLPGAEALQFRRHGSMQQMRAYDYNLFAQEMFSRWATQLIAVIRAAGSPNLVVVGQDEGGVSNRILNQFYADSGVAFTSNHSWWNDDALLWDSFAAKRKDIPNVIGETGMQPAWRVDGTWRLDEVAAHGLIERKLALGLAAANGGSLFWDWSCDDVFGLKRSDGSDKIWLAVLGDIGRFARQIAPHLGRPIRPEVAVVLPQSLQLSVMNRYAVEAQQKCVRALHYHARSLGYAVGEHQIQLLGQPKLILLPSPWILSESAWQALLEKVRAGAVLAVTGLVDQDEHFQPSDRLGPIGITCARALLDARETSIRWDDEQASLTYSGDKITFLERGKLNDDQSLVRKALGQGQILYCPWPIELNDNLDAIGRFYRLALHAAGVRPAYTTEVPDLGILIAPTQLETGTLYVLTSESSETVLVAFRDGLSGADVRVRLEPGRAALLMILKDGGIAGSYNVSVEQRAIHSFRGSRSAIQE